MQIMNLYTLYARCIMHASICKAHKGMYSLGARQPHGVEPCMLCGTTIISGTFMFLVLLFGVLLISVCMVLLKAYLMFIVTL